MKIITAFLLGVIWVFLVGCSTPLGQSVDRWWKSPATQTGIYYAEQAASQFAINAALAALQQYAGGGKLNYQQIAVTGGINTLYMQANNIRQLQGTAQVIDPVATARLLEQGGTSQAISQKLAQQLFDNASALIAAGASPNSAAEVNAMALDKAAAIVTAATEVSK